MNKVDNLIIIAAALVLLFALNMLTGCGGTGGSSATTPDIAIPSNYFEVTKTCQQVPAFVMYVRMINAGSWDVYFFSTEADCLNGTIDSFCHVFTDETDPMFPNNCGPVYIIEPEPYPLADPDNVWVTW